MGIRVQPIHVLVNPASRMGGAVLFPSDDCLGCGVHAADDGRGRVAGMAVDGSACPRDVLGVQSAAGRGDAVFAPASYSFEADRDGGSAATRVRLLRGVRAARPPARKVSCVLSWLTRRSSSAGEASHAMKTGWGIGFWIAQPALEKLG